MEKTLPYSFEEMYRALLHRDESYEGLFYACIKSTKIFCRSSCKAKKPKPENVKFLLSKEDALNAGYRPCKLCRPMDNLGEVPKEIQNILQFIKKNPSQKITDQNLLDLNLNPVYVRRWFKNNYGTTFQSYQRKIKLSNAMEDIRAGENVITAAVESGYNSLSGFNHTFKKLIECTPSKSKEKIKVTIKRFATPLGQMIAGVNDDGLVMLEFVNRKNLDNEIKTFETKYNFILLPGENPLLDDVTNQVMEYFEGSRKEFDIPLVFTGTTFQKAAWKALLDIPYGKTICYSEQANVIGNQKAIRAIGTANSCNKIAIVVPCHRVIGKNGTLTGYAGGLDKKDWLLEHERKILSRI